MASKNVLTLFLFALATQAVDATELWRLPLDEKTELLKGRIVVLMPHGAKTEARGHDIMSAPQPDESETRCVVSAGKERFVLMANDLHAYKGKDFSYNVDRLLLRWQQGGLGKFSRSSAVLKSEGGLEYVLLSDESEPCKRANDTHFVNGAVLANADGSVQYMAAYVNDEATKEWGHATSLAMHVLRAATLGSRKPDLAARTVDVDDFEKLRISLPQSTAVSTQLGPDFRVFRCFPMSILGDVPSSLMIYVGYHPSFRPDLQAKARSSKILGQTAEWFRRKDDVDSVAIECLVPLPQPSHAVLHIIASAPNEREIDELLKIAATLAIRFSSNSGHSEH